MITVEKLLAAGYKRYASSRVYTTNLYQKWIYSGSVKLYAINIYEYSHRSLAGTAFVAEASFYICDWVDPDRPWFIVQMHEATNLENVELFFETAYERMNFVPDIHNQD